MVFKLIHMDEISKTKKINQKQNKTMGHSKLATIIPN
jgi:hypothetical protein